MTQKRLPMVIGADGLLGRQLANHIKASGQSFFETTRRPGVQGDKRFFLDFADISEWRPPVLVSVAYICAAVSLLDVCRRYPLATANINVDGTVGVAAKLAAAGAHVVMISSSAVFDGSVPFRKAEDPVCPNTEYGRQKAEAERLLLANLGEQISIVRFSKILWPKMPLIESWVDSLKAGQVIHPFSDMAIAPISVTFAAHVLSKVGVDRLVGISQISGKRDMTYFKFANHMADCLGASRDLVQPITSGESGLDLEAAPRFNSLDSTRLSQALGLEPPDVSSVDYIFAG